MIFFIATAFSPGTCSITLSTSAKGYLCGKSPIICSLFKAKGLEEEMSVKSDLIKLIPFVEMPQTQHEENENLYKQKFVL